MEDFGTAARPLAANARPRPAGVGCKVGGGQATPRRPEAAAGLVTSGSGCKIDGREDQTL